MTSHSSSEEAEKRAAKAAAGRPPAGRDTAASAIVLGIDPGLQRTGYALLQQGPTGPVLLEGGVIRSERTGSLADRVLEIGQGVAELLTEFAPQSVAIEQVFSQPKHPKTAVLMAHARGAILYAVAASGRPLLHYTPRQVKKLLTGSGAASKDQVQQAVQRELGLARLLEPNDVADACAIALCHFYSYQRDRLRKYGNVDCCAEVRRDERRQSGEDHGGCAARGGCETGGPPGGDGRLRAGPQDG